ncbi:unnamed protein product [Knipowitschia caucasica]|uniref:DNA-directed RNA polymerase subunit n=1 Tax=Knipowitschia caucasica TaxID=637954 RepID=A0AAV2K7U5_KNICA
MADPQRAKDSSKHAPMSRGTATTSTPDVGPVEEAGVAASIPCFSRASELLSAPYSCLVLNTHRRHIALPPLHLHKKRTGIRQELDTELLKFSHRLSGVPLAYDDIRILGQQGDIFDDSGYIHLNIEANFIVFQPKKGQTLLGKVNKLGANHVGCLVHGCFNASILKPNLVSMETWRYAGPQIGSELMFDVTALDADFVGVLLIRGRMKKTRVQELLAIGESMAFTVQPAIQQWAAGAQPDDQPADQPADQSVDLPMHQTIDQITEPMDTPSDETPKKKKKKKRDKIKEEAPFTPEKDTTVSEAMSEPLCDIGGNTKKKKKVKVKEESIDVPVTLPFNPEYDRATNTTAELNGTKEEETNGSEEKKKKKKKKDKRFKEEPQEVAVTMEVHGSDSSGYPSYKPKKRKVHSQSEDSPGFSQEFEMPCKKKIKTLTELKEESLTF